MTTGPDRREKHRDGKPERCSVDERHAHGGTQENARPGSTPRRFRMIAKGQKPVKDDWSRLAPTNAASHSQFRLTKCASRRLTSTTVPANLITQRSILMFVFEAIYKKVWHIVSVNAKLAIDDPHY